MLDSLFLKNLLKYPADDNWIGSQEDIENDIQYHQIIHNTMVKSAKEKKLNIKLYQQKDGQMTLTPGSKISRKGWLITQNKSGIPVKIDLKKHCPEIFKGRFSKTCLLKHSLAFSLFKNDEGDFHVEPELTGSKMTKNGHNRYIAKSKQSIIKRSLALGKDWKKRRYIARKIEFELWFSNETAIATALGKAGPQTSRRTESKKYDIKRKFYSSYEYLGATLKNFLNTYKNQLTELERLYFAKEFVDSLCLLHSQGYTHQDIKPDNTTIDKNGKIQLIDFGNAEQGSIKSIQAQADQGTLPYSLKRQYRTQISKAEGDLVALARSIFYPAFIQNASDETKFYSQIDCCGILSDTILAEHPELKDLLLHLACPDGTPINGNYTINHLLTCLEKTINEYHPVEALFKAINKAGIITNYHDIEVFITALNRSDQNILSEKSIRQIKDGLVIELKRNSDFNFNTNINKVISCFEKNFPKKFLSGYQVNDNNSKSFFNDFNTIVKSLSPEDINRLFEAISEITTINEEDNFNEIAALKSIDAPNQIGNKNPLIHITLPERLEKFIDKLPRKHPALWTKLTSLLIKSYNEKIEVEKSSKKAFYDSNKFKSFLSETLTTGSINQKEIKSTDDAYEDKYDLIDDEEKMKPDPHNIKRGNKNITYYDYSTNNNDHKEEKEEEKEEEEKYNTIDNEFKMPNNNNNYLPNIINNQKSINNSITPKIFDILKPNIKRNTDISFYISTLNKTLLTNKEIQIIKEHLTSHIQYLEQNFKKNRLQKSHQIEHHHKKIRAIIRNLQNLSCNEFLKQCKSNIQAYIKNLNPPLGPNELEQVRRKLEDDFNQSSPIKKILKRNVRHRQNRVELWKTIDTSFQNAIKQKTISQQKPIENFNKSKEKKEDFIINHEDIAKINGIVNNKYKLLNAIKTSIDPKISTHSDIKELVKELSLTALDPQKIIILQRVLQRNLETKITKHVKSTQTNINNSLNIKEFKEFKEFLEAIEKITQDLSYHETNEIYNRITGHMKTSNNAFKRMRAPFFYNKRKHLNITFNKILHQKLEKSLQKKELVDATKFNEAMQGKHSHIDTIHIDTILNKIRPNIVFNKNNNERINIHLSADRNFKIQANDTNNINNYIHELITKTTLKSEEIKWIKNSLELYLIAEKNLLLSKIEHQILDYLHCKIFSPYQIKKLQKYISTLNVNKEMASHIYRIIKAKIINSKNGKLDNCWNKLSNRECKKIEQAFELLEKNTNNAQKKPVIQDIIKLVDEKNQSLTEMITKYFNVSKLAEVSPQLLHIDNIDISIHQIQENNPNLSLPQLNHIREILENLRLKEQKKTVEGKFLEIKKMIKDTEIKALITCINQLDLRFSKEEIKELYRMLKQPYPPNASYEDHINRYWPKTFEWLKTQDANVDGKNIPPQYCRNLRRLFIHVYDRAPANKKTLMNQQNNPIIVNNNQNLLLPHPNNLDKHNLTERYTTTPSPIRASS